MDVGIGHDLDDLLRGRLPVVLACLGIGIDVLVDDLSHRLL
jgi:hypothetical protein